MAIDISGLLSGGSQLAAAYLPYQASQEASDTLANMANRFIEESGKLGQIGAEAAQFKPFSITTGTGTTSVGEGGAIDLGLAEAPQAIQQSLLGSAQAAAGALGGGIPNLTGLQQQAFGQAGSTLDRVTTQDQALAAQQRAMQGLFTGQLGTFGLPQQTLEGLTGTALLGAQAGLEAQAPDVTGAYTGISAPSISQAASDVASQYLTAGQQALGAATPTASSLYQDIRAMQTPEEERQRLALENRLAAQGRLGVSTAAYGGTPEQLALAKAQEEARNTAAFQATQMADQLATSAQNRAQQLTAQGLNAEQVQAQLNAEGFGQAMQLATAGISAQQAQSGLQTQQQARAAQLAQLGLTGTQAGQQLTTQQLANLTGLQQATMAGATGQQALQQGALGLGTGLFGLGAQAAQLPQQMTGTDIANLQNILATSYLPESQQLSALQSAIQTSKLAQAGSLGEAEALYKSGIAGLTTEADLVSAQAALEAQRSRDLATALTGLFATSSSGQTTPLNDLITNLLGGTTSSSSSSSGNSWWDSLSGAVSGLFGGASDSGSAYANSLSDQEFFDTYGYFRGEA